MSQLLRRSPRLLKRLLVQSTGSTPKALCKLARPKRKLSPSDTGNDKLEGVDQGSKRTKTDFTSLAYEAVSSDSRSTQRDKLPLQQHWGGYCVSNYKGCLLSRSRQVHVSTKACADQW